MIHSSISGHLRFSIAWLLQIVLPRTREYRCLFKLKSFFFSDKYPEVEWLDLIWTVLRRTGQVFCRPPLYWVSSDSFLMIRLPSWVWGRKTTKVNCRSRHMRSRVYSISVTYYGWGWPWPPGWGSVGQFSPLKNFSFSSFHATHFGRQSLDAACTWGVGSLSDSLLPASSSLSFQNLQLSAALGWA